MAVANLALLRNGQGIDAGQGAFVVTPDGVAGVFSGRASVAAAGASLGGDLGLRVNTSASEEHQIITVGGRTVAIDFGATEKALSGTPYFQIFGSNLSLQLSDFATVAGDVGTSDHMIGGLLGHAVPGIRRRYARRTDTALHDAATKVSAEIAARLELSLGGKKKRVSLRRPAKR